MCRHLKLTFGGVNLPSLLRLTARSANLIIVGGQHEVQLLIASQTRNKTASDLSRSLCWPTALAGARAGKSVGCRHTDRETDRETETEANLGVFVINCLHNYAENASVKSAGGAAVLVAGFRCVCV